MGWLGHQHWHKVPGSELIWGLITSCCVSSILGWKILKYFVVFANVPWCELWRFPQKMTLMYQLVVSKWSKPRGLILLRLNRKAALLNIFQLEQSKTLAWQRHNKPPLVHWYSILRSYRTNHVNNCQRPDWRQLSASLQKYFQFTTPVYTEIVISQLAAGVVQHFYIVVPGIVLWCVVRGSEGIVRVLSRGEPGWGSKVSSWHGLHSSTTRETFQNKNEKILITSSNSTFQIFKIFPSWMITFYTLYLWAGWAIQTVLTMPQQEVRKSSREEVSWCHGVTVPTPRTNTATNILITTYQHH